MNSCCLVIGMNYSSQNCRTYWFHLEKVKKDTVKETEDHHIAFLHHTYDQWIQYSDNIQKNLQKKSLFCDCTNLKFAARTTFVQNQKLQHTDANTNTHRPNGLRSKRSLRFQPVFNISSHIHTTRVLFTRVLSTELQGCKL